MSQEILGIDLGTYSIKILRIERQAQEVALLDFFDLPLSLHGRNTHHEQVQEVLTKFFSEHHLPADVVCATIPGHTLSARILDVPFTNQKKIAQAADFELEGHIPFPVEDIFCDHQILTQDNGHSEILCAYTFEDNVRKYLDVFDQCGVDVKYLGADFADFAAIVPMAVIPTEGCYALCDIGHSKTTFLLMEGGTLKYARTIGVGGLHFTRAIQRSYNLNYEKAEALKLSRGKLYVREMESDQVSRILSRVASELVSYIKQTILAGLKHVDGKAVDAIFLCGGGTKMVGIQDYLAFHLQANVFELDALVYTAHHFDDAFDVARIIPQVLSTAVKPLYLHRTPAINFRKGPFAFKKDFEAVAREVKMLGVFLCLILLSGAAYYLMADHHYSGKVVQIVKKVDDLVKNDFPELAGKSGKGADKKDPTTKIKNYISSVNSKVKEYDALFGAGAKGEDVLVVLQEISKKLPSKSEVSFETKEFQFVEDYVSMKASTTDTLNVEKIVDALKQSNLFASVVSNDAKPMPGGVWDFELKLQLHKGQEE